MDFITESRIVYIAVSCCIAFSQLYFLAKRRSFNKVYLMKASQRGYRSEEIKGYEVRYGGSWRRGACNQTLIKHKSSLPDLDRWLKLMYGTSVLINMCLALKYFTLCLLDSRSMRDYRYLDCLLIGRISMNGRTTSLGKYIGLCLPIFQLWWRFIMLYLRPNFNFVFMEFLLQNPNELIEWEAEAQRRHKQWNKLPGASAPIKHSRLAAKSGPEGATYSNADRLYAWEKQSDVEYKYSTLLNYKNPFAAEENFSRLRPNRTFGAWLWTSQWLLFYLLSTCVSALVSLIGTSFMFLPLILTRPGFRLNYYNCAEWISRQSNKHQYAFIDTTTANDTKAALSMAAVFMPYDDYVELNSYHSIRITIDIFETLFVFFEAYMSFVIYTTAAVICAADMYYYIDSINRRVEWMIATLVSDKRLGEQVNKSLLGSRSLAGLALLSGEACTDRKLVDSCFRQQHGLDTDNDYQAQILDIQAMIVDMFALIDLFNPFAAFFTMYTLAVWFIYSAVCSVPWLFMPLMAETSKLEWYLFEAVSTLFVFIIIGAFNQVRSSTTKLYRSLSTLAMLDYTKMEGKRDRWLGILKLYSPIPLHCFTALGTSQICWLLGLKMFSWLASAFIVTTSFLRAKTI